MCRGGVPEPSPPAGAEADGESSGLLPEGAELGSDEGAGVEVGPWVGPVGSGVLLVGEGAGVVGSCVGGVLGLSVGFGEGSVGSGVGAGVGAGPTLTYTSQNAVPPWPSSAVTARSSSPVYSGGAV
ncbi:hypothetical protein GCM10025784_22460 [Citricoccus nitrophenolicus]